MFLYEISLIQKQDWLLCSYLLMISDKIVAFSIDAGPWTQLSVTQQKEQKIKYGGVFKIRNISRKWRAVSMADQLIHKCLHQEEHGGTVYSRKKAFSQEHASSSLLVQNNTWDSQERRWDLE